MNIFFFRKILITTAMSRDFDMSWQPALTCHAAAAFHNHRELHKESYIYENTG